MTDDRPLPPPRKARNQQLLQGLEAAAQRELAALCDALPESAAPDPLLAALGWDLGLPGEAVSR